MRPVEPVDIEREKRYLEILAIVLFIVSSIWVLWKAFRRPASLENSRPKEQKVLIGQKLIIHAIMTPGKLTFPKRFARHQLKLNRRRFPPISEIPQIGFTF